MDRGKVADIHISFLLEEELKIASSFAKVYDPNNSDDLKELDALFYLDSFEGRPMNMLNICLGCE